MNPIGTITLPALLPPTLEYPTAFHQRAAGPPPLEYPGTHHRRSASPPRNPPRNHRVAQLVQDLNAQHAFPHAAGAYEQRWRNFIHDDAQADQYELMHGFEVDRRLEADYINVMHQMELADSDYEFE